MRAVLFIAMLVLASCAPPQAATDAPAAGSGAGSQSAAKDDTQACVARGGTMRRICLRGDLACVETFSDAGKTCTDKKDCQGQCRYSGPSLPIGTTVVGQCQRTTDPCGCFATVANGKLEGALCVD